MHLSRSRLLRPDGPCGADPSLLHLTGGHWVPVAVQIPRGSALQMIPDFSGPQLAHVPGTRSMLAIGILQAASHVDTSVVLAYGALPK